MENLKIFFTNLSKNTKKSDRPAPISDTNLPSALRRSKSNIKSDKPHSHSDGVRFESSKVEQVPEADNITGTKENQKNDNIKPQLIRLLDQIQNRKNESVEEQGSPDGVKQRLSKSLNNLELNSNSDQEQVNGNRNNEDNEKLGRAYSEGNSMIVQYPTLISEHLPPIKIEELPPSQTVQGIDKFAVSDGVEDSDPSTLIRQESDLISNHGRVRGTDENIDPRDGFTERRLTSFRHPIPFKDKPDWGQLPKEPSAELDTPRIVLTTDSGQHKLIASPSVNPTRLSPGGFSIASWIGESENRTKLALPPAFIALDVENCGFVPVEAIKSYWNKLGVPEVDTVLQALGFDSAAQTVLLSELTTALEGHLVAGRTDDGRDDVTRLAAILTVLNEWRQARSTIAGLLKEKDKLMRELQQLNMNIVADRSAAYIAMERKYREQLEAFEQEHTEQSKLIRSHHAKQVDAQRRNLMEQLDLNERLRAEVIQKSQENNELRGQMENFKEQLLLTQSVIQQTHNDLVSANQTSEKLENQLVQMQHMKIEYERFMECKTQLDELVQAIQDLPISDDPCQKLNRTLMEKIDSLKSQLVSTREELLVERQLGQNLQITVTELRAENDRLEQDGQQFELDRINLEKHCEELNQQVNQQAELLAQMDSMRPVECPRVADNVKGLRSVKFCLDGEEPRKVIRQQVDVLLQYCADPTSETTAATPQTVPIPKKRTTSATTPSSHANGNSSFGATALAQQKRYTSTATLNRF
ncbi:hypothetical protein D915_003137 [Fasciola hepatica]|uniref:Uncharacterized protein n=1 Tax=Fasciola hepatica TaxID=6192 RepID=A0A4E0RII4_FASHE|nr:hypothetical protein D915_003137 [Fasciola hepatica]